MGDDNVRFARAGALVDIHAGDDLDVRTALLLEVVDEIGHQAAKHWRINDCEADGLDRCGLSAARRRQRCKLQQRKSYDTAQQASADRHVFLLIDDMPWAIAAIVTDLQHEAIDRWCSVASIKPMYTTDYNETKQPVFE